MISFLVIALMAVVTFALPASGLVVSLVWLHTGLSTRKVTVAMAICCGSTLLGMFLTTAAAFVAFNAALDCMYDCSNGLPWQ